MTPTHVPLTVEQDLARGFPFDVCIRLDDLAEDALLGFRGTLRCKCGYGCTQWELVPRVKQIREQVNGTWYDETQVVVLGVNPLRLGLDEHCSKLKREGLERLFIKRAAVPVVAVTALRVDVGTA